MDALAVSNAAFERRDHEISAWNEALTAELEEAKRRLLETDRELAGTRAAFASKLALFDQARVAVAEAREALQESGAGLAAGEAAIGELRRTILALLASRRLRWPEAAVAWAVGPSPEAESFARVDAATTRTTLPRLAANQHRSAAGIAKLDAAAAALRRPGADRQD
jgi:hypothetical protein